MPVLGIDVSKRTLDVALIFDGKTLARRFANTKPGFRTLQAWLGSLHLSRVHACLEATGHYGEAVAEFLFGEGHVVSVVNPARIKGYGQARLTRQKTDRADARLIADFCRTQQPAPWAPPSPEVKHLQALVRRLDALEELLLMERNRLESALPKVRESLQRMIAALEQEIAEVEKLIKEHFNDHPGLKQQSDLLQTIPGIGEKTARRLLSEIEFHRFDSARQVAALAGLVPQKRQSGTSLNHTRLSKIGNSRVRKALYLPAVVAKRFNPVVHQFAQRLAQNGKNNMQIVCACMRKLIHIAFGILKSRKPFRLILLDC
jgi:transposase